MSKFRIVTLCRPGWALPTMLLGLLVGGCATSQKPPRFQLIAEFAVAGKIKSHEEIGVFVIGDLEESWQRYTIEAKNEYGSGPLEFVSAGGDCSITGLPEQDYLVLLYTREFWIIPPNLSKPSNLKEDWHVASLCLPIDAQTATDVQMYRQD